MYGNLKANNSKKSLFLFLYFCEIGNESKNNRKCVRDRVALMINDKNTRTIFSAAIIQI